MVYNITGTSYWAKVFPETAQENKYSIDVCNLDQATIKLCKELGLKVKNINDKREDHVSFWTYATFPDGSTKDLTVLDSALNPLKKLIGNTSKVSVEFNMKPWEYKGKSGKRGDLKALHVLELSEYNAPPGSTFKAVEGGYKTAPRPKVEAIADDEIPFDMPLPSMGEEAVA